MKIFQFLGSSSGRVTRALAGLAIILLAFIFATGTWQWIIALVGVVPLAAGVFDFCLFAPLFGLPFVGERLRESLP